MNIKCENIVDPEVSITTDGKFKFLVSPLVSSYYYNYLLIYLAGDQNLKEANISSFHEDESNIENISLDSQKTYGNTYFLTLFLLFHSYY